MACLASDCIDFVKKFLELGQDPNLLVEKTGDSPLHFAARRPNGDALKLLLMEGADPNLSNKDGLTPLHIIGNSYNERINYAMKDFFEVNDYLERTLQINARDKLGNTPLHLAISCVRTHGNMYAMKLLLRRGADPNLANAEGSTALHLICKRRDYYDIVSNKYCEDDIVERYFKIIDDQNQTLQIDARDGLGRTPLQLAVASLEPKAVDSLFDHGADLSNFVFPDENHFGEELKARECESWFKFRRASSALAVVERLENRGYEFDRNDALTIMKLFAKHELFDKSVDLDKCWCDDLQEFVRNARRIMIKPNLSFYDLVQLRPKEAAKQFTCTDYYNIWYAKNFWKRPYREAYLCANRDSHLCEKLSRRFFRKWALDSFMELIHYRLPILCCDMIIEQLANEDLYNICLAAADQIK
ncbi:unnamed protein product [Trichogramma brassicae]|uniref:Uncharacterized protein n=1 Tax=Trichogramma brassicae TaxID=86971 RepID=A0A6H5INK3_9HYME|nr:unnamed protein product [Trichogramma brassicae]